MRASSSRSAVKLLPGPAPALTSPFRASCRQRKNAILARRCRAFAFLSPYAFSSEKTPIFRAARSDAGCAAAGLSLSCLSPSRLLRPWIAAAFFVSTEADRRVLAFRRRHRLRRCAQEPSEGALDFLFCSLFRRVFIAPRKKIGQTALKCSGRRIFGSQMRKALPPRDPPLPPQGRGEMCGPCALKARSALKVYRFEMIFRRKCAYSPIRQDRASAARDSRT